MWSEPVTIVPPASEPVTLDEAKEFLSIDAEETEFDVLIESLITAAREQVEAITGLRLVEQTVDLRASEWSDLQLLPIGPVLDVANMSYLDGVGDEQAVPGDVYELYGAGLSRGLQTSIGKSWPSDALRRRDAIRLELTIGYGPVPKPLWAAILLMVGDVFANRETVVTGTSAAKIPTSMAIDSILVNYRLWG
jgi:uncharacterized phiE125 gp8 family phage protein